MARTSARIASKAQAASLRSPRKCNARTASPEAVLPTSTPSQKSSVGKGSTGTKRKRKVLWTDEETKCLLEALGQCGYLVAKGKMINPWNHVLLLHGPAGSGTQTLRSRDERQLHDKARDVLVKRGKMKKMMPFWQPLLMPNFGQRASWMPQNGKLAVEEMPAEFKQANSKSRKTSSASTGQIAKHGNNTRQGSSSRNSTSKESVGNTVGGSFQPWTQEETQCLLENLDQLPSLVEQGEIERSSQIFQYILDQHGSMGTKTQTLRRDTAHQLRGKAVTELQWCYRNNLKLPDWQPKLFPSFPYEYMKAPRQDIEDVSAEDEDISTDEEEDGSGTDDDSAQEEDEQSGPSSQGPVVRPRRNTLPRHPVANPQPQAHQRATGALETSSVERSEQISYHFGELARLFGGNPGRR
ncbi:hypothetical protein CF326_g8453 [Tilletia indica]|nr:hypothetical protein CF326_g8453 [Tilletia indica]